MTGLPHQVDYLLESQLEILHSCLTTEGFLTAEEEFKKLELLEPNKKKFSTAYRVFISLRDSGVKDPFSPQYIQRLKWLRAVLLGDTLEYDFHKIAKDIGIDEGQLITIERNIIQELIMKISNNHALLDRISPRDFEKLIGEIFLSMGYHIELTKQTRDGGYDLIAIKKVNGFPVKFLVECKRHSQMHPVDIRIIRSFLFVVDQERANKGIIVTTSYFTNDAKKQQAIQGHILDLRDRDNVLNWIRDYDGKLVK